MTPRPTGPDGRPTSLRQWFPLVRLVARDMILGYLLLGAVDVAYYYGIARVAGNFIDSAFTGTAMLMGLATPVFAALSWLAERRRPPAAKSGHPPGHGDRSPTGTGPPSPSRRHETAAGGDGP